MYIFIAYLALTMLHIVITGVSWNRTRLGCKVLASNTTLQRTVNKLGFGVYFALPAFLGLIAFSVYTLICVLTLYDKVLAQGTIAGGQLFILQRKILSGGLLTAAIIAFVVCLSTFYSFC